jgi:hypothetical protein
MKIKVKKQQTDLLRHVGTVVTTTKGDVYRYLPFWFKETPDKDIYDLLTFEELPDDLIETIKDMRK